MRLYKMSSIQFACMPVTLTLDPHVHDNNVLPDSIVSFKHLGIGVREQFKIDGLPHTQFTIGICVRICTL